MGCLLGKRQFRVSRNSATPSCLADGFHPIRPRSRPRRRPKGCFHHFVSHPAKEEGISLVEVLDRVTMQLLVRDYCTVIAATVQCDVDGIPKGSHYARVPPMGHGGGEKATICF